MERANLAGTLNMIVRPANEASVAKKDSFIPGQAIVFDVAITDARAEFGSGEGKFKHLGETHRTTVYSRTGRTHSLRLKISRSIVNELAAHEKKHNNSNGNGSSFMGFHTRILSEVTKKSSRAGFTECIKAGVLWPYEVFSDKSLRARVVRFSCTVLIGANAEERPSALTDPFYSV